MMKKSLTPDKTQKGFFRGDRRWLTFVIMLNVMLLFWARNQMQTVNELSIHMISRSPAGVEKNEIFDETSELNRLAKKGAWEEFEKARMESVAHFLETHTRPTSGEALYFFPETLPDQSLEKEFALQRLKPKIEALRKARKKREKTEISRAYQKLKSGVMNYELGAHASPEDLSEEAKRFLNLYQEFSKL